MIRILLLLLLALPAFGAEPRLVVIPFQDSGTHSTATGLETVLQDLLIARLSQAQAVVVLEREKLDLVLKEHHLSASGLVDPLTATKAGKLIGADFIVLGSFSLNDGKLRVHARAVSVAATAAVVAADEITSSPRELIEIGDQLGGRLLDGLHLKTQRLPALAADPSPDANLCFLRGVADFISAQYDAAQEQFLKARQRNPQHFEALLWSGHTYLMQKQYAHAAIDLARFDKQALNHPELGKARRWLAECHGHLTPEQKAFLAELQKGH